MSKKIGIAIVAILMIAGVFVYASNRNSKQTAANCPDKPGCVCSKSTK